MNILGPRKYKLSKNNAFCIIRSILGIVWGTFMLMMMGGMFSQTNGCTYSYNIKGYFDIAVTGNKHINFNQVIHMHDANICEYLGYFLVWLGTWTLVRNLTCDVKSGIKGGRGDLRIQIKSDSLSACKYRSCSRLMTMTCYAIISCLVNLAIVVIYGLAYPGFTYSHFHLYASSFSSSLATF